MKSFKIKCFFSLGLIVLLGGGLAFWGLQKDEFRSPAFFSEKKIIPTLNIFEKQNDLYLKFPKGFNVCDDQQEILFVLETMNTAVLSKSEPKIQIHISSTCKRPFKSPIFIKNFCIQGLMYEDYGGVLYKMINGMGFFPRKWKFKTILIGEVEVSFKNQPILKTATFSCD